MQGARGSAEGRDKMKNMSERKRETNEIIKASFYELRRKNPLSAIKVAEICRIAEISRRTFYLYYQDVIDLNDAYEDEVLNSSLKNFCYQGLIYTDPVTFFNEFSKFLLPVKAKLEVLGSGRELEQQKKIESCLVKLGQKEFTEDEALFLGVIVAGSVSLCEKYLKAPSEKKALIRMKSILLIQQMLKTREEACAKKEEKKFNFADILRYKNMRRTEGGMVMNYLLRLVRA